MPDGHPSEWKLMFEVCKDLGLSRHSFILLLLEISWIYCCSTGLEETVTSLWRDLRYKSVHELLIWQSNLNVGFYQIDRVTFIWTLKCIGGGSGFFLSSSTGHRYTILASTWVVTSAFELRVCYKCPFWTPLLCLSGGVLNERCSFVSLWTILQSLVLTLLGHSLPIYFLNENAFLV